jgi:hypothetical protein
MDDHPSIPEHHVLRQSRRIGGVIDIDFDLIAQGFAFALAIGRGWLLVKLLQKGRSLKCKIGALVEVRMLKSGIDRFLLAYLRRLGTLLRLLRAFALDHDVCSVHQEQVWLVKNTSNRCRPWVS